MKFLICVSAVFELIFVWQSILLIKYYTTNVELLILINMQTYISL